MKNSIKKEYKITITLNGETKTFESTYGIDVQFIEELYSVMEDETLSVDTLEKLYDIGAELIMKDSNDTPLYKLAQFLVNLEKENKLDSLYETEGRYGLLEIFYNTTDLNY